MEEKVSGTLIKATGLQRLPVALSTHVPQDRSRSRGPGKSRLAPHWGLGDGTHSAPLLPVKQTSP